MQILSTIYMFKIPIVVVMNKIGMKSPYAKAIQTCIIIVEYLKWIKYSGPEYKSINAYL